jgi:hypothetical protein
MKSQLHPVTLLILSGALSACTSVKRDDHSYTYIYQHTPGPQRQVVETVTTHQTKTRRFTAPEDGPVSYVDPDSTRNDDGAEPDLRADPLPPPVRRPAYLGRSLDAAQDFYRMPVRTVSAPYRMPPPVSYYRPTVLPY